jgi:DNA-binding HxlR family transcriptional regulator
MSEKCTVLDVFHALSGKWTLPVLYHLNLDRGPQRFGELRRAVGRITTSELTKTLRYLESIGLVTRVQYAEIPVRVEYKTTPLGTSLQSPLLAFDEWLQGHQEEAQHFVRIREGAKQAAETLTSRQ